MSTLARLAKLAGKGDSILRLSWGDKAMPWEMHDEFFIQRHSSDQGHWAACTPTREELTAEDWVWAERYCPCCGQRIRNVEGRDKNEE